MNNMCFVFVHICVCSPHEWPGFQLGIASLHVHLGSGQANAASCLLLCGMIRVMLNSVWAKVWELDSPAYETSMVLHRIPKNSIRLHRIRNGLNNMNWDYMSKNVWIGRNFAFSRIAHKTWNKRDAQTTNNAKWVFFNIQSFCIDYLEERSCWSIGFYSTMLWKTHIVSLWLSSLNPIP